MFSICPFVFIWYRLLVASLAAIKFDRLELEINACLDVWTVTHLFLNELSWGFFLFFVFFNGYTKWFQTVFWSKSNCNTFKGCILGEIHILTDLTHMFQLHLETHKMWGKNISLLLSLLHWSLWTTLQVCRPFTTHRGMSARLQLLPVMEHRES